MTAEPDAEELFWQLAEPLLTRPSVTRSTMMGLRLHGAFFASYDRRGGDRAPSRLPLTPRSPKPLVICGRVRR